LYFGWDEYRVNVGVTDRILIIQVKEAQTTSITTLICMDHYLE